MILFVPQRCQPWRHKKAECNICLEACPVEGCLSFKGNSVSVEKDLCNGCGICTTACPSGALVLEWLDDLELQKRLVKASDGKPLTLFCGLGPETKDGCIQPEGPEGSCLVKVPCLAVIKESHLVHLAFKNSLNITLDCSRCYECSFSSGKDIIDRTIAYAQNLMAALGAPGRIDVLKEHPSQRGSIFGRGGRAGRKKGVREITPAPELSRRELFNFLGEKARATAAERILGKTVDRGDANAGRTGEVPERRAVLLDALKDGPEAASATLADGEFPVRALTLNGCVMCSRCDNYCPTEALKRVEHEGETAIEFDLALCMSCYQCKELCTDGAISYNGVIGLKPMVERGAVTLAAMTRVPCPKCSKQYHPELEKDGCPTCAKRSRLDGMIQTIIFGHGEDDVKPGSTSKEVT
jgi:formate hydrogenlyase subunit 6/NADH:ubiquinone oxidoreductase subunit I